MEFMTGLNNLPLKNETQTPPLPRARFGRRLLPVRIPSIARFDREGSKC